MTPEAIVAAVTAIAEAAAEGFKFAQTSQGQALIEQAIRDRVALDKGIKDLGAYISNLVKGQL